MADGKPPLRFSPELRAALAASASPWHGRIGAPSHAKRGGGSDAGEPGGPRLAARSATLRMPPSAHHLLLSGPSNPLNRWAPSKPFPSTVGADQLGAVAPVWSSGARAEHGRPFGAAARVLDFFHCQVRRWPRSTPKCPNRQSKQQVCSSSGVDVGSTSRSGYFFSLKLL